MIRQRKHVSAGDLFGCLMVFIVVGLPCLWIVCSLYSILSKVPPAGSYVPARAVTLDACNLTSTKAGQGELTDDAASGDLGSIRLRSAAGDVHEISAGTQAEVIDTSGWSARVRILSGPNAGQTGWVPRDSL